MIYNSLQHTLCHEVMGRTVSPSPLLLTDIWFYKSLRGDKRFYSLCLTFSKVERFCRHMYVSDSIMRIEDAADSIRPWEDTFLPSIIVTEGTSIFINRTNTLVI